MIGALLIFFPSEGRIPAGLFVPDSWFGGGGGGAGLPLGGGPCGGGGRLIGLLDGGGPRGEGGCAIAVTVAIPLNLRLEDEDGLLVVDAIVTVVNQQIGRMF